ncbi:LYR motif-containing protein 4 isoform X1 [Xiphophorus couchianus]|uniref:LYR motif-containing protein 4 isoform X1 n=1 Tax=Xiphophorus couchianus TaxID=32473 RepID=UPI001016C775|nr:LYR motif-containing protein 4 isoform X1 [Xiphophorus couchianus]
MAASTRSQVISLYKMMLKESSRFPSYNYRSPSGKCTRLSGRWWTRRDASARPVKCIVGDVGRSEAGRCSCLMFLMFPLQEKLKLRFVFPET